MMDKQPLRLRDQKEFEFESYNGEMLWMLTEAEKFCCEYERRETPRWLALLGNSGVGKTMLAKYCAEHLGIPFRKWSWIVDLMRKRDYGVKDWIIGERAIVIDDIGAGYETSFAQSLLDELADRRLGKWTILTSNYSLQQIGDEISHRVRSRMIRGGNKVVEALNSKCWHTMKSEAIQND